MNQQKKYFLYTSFIFLILLNFKKVNAQVQPFIDFKGSEVLDMEASSSFLAPNELYPELGKYIWNQANENGVYISVGTDRSFIGASLATGASYLLAVDLNPAVVMYNRIIIAMLVLAKDQADFIRMRTDAHGHFKEILSSSKKELYPGINKIELLKYLERFDNILALKEDSYGFPTNEFNWFWFMKGKRSDVRYFENPSLFIKLKKMAVEGRMKSEILDLSNKSELLKLSKSLEEKGIKISVIDFSNMHSSSYLGIDGVKKVLESLKGQMTKKSMLLFVWVRLMPGVKFKNWEKQKKVNLEVKEKTPSFYIIMFEYFAYYYEDFKKKLVSTQRGTKESPKKIASSHGGTKESPKKFFGFEGTVTDRTIPFSPLELTHPEGEEKALTEEEKMLKSKETALYKHFKGLDQLQDQIFNDYNKQRKKHLGKK